MNITPQNYDVQLLGTESVGGRRCYVLGLHARHKSKYLLNGKAWVDAQEFGLVRMAGLACRESLVLGGKALDRPEFLTKLGDFWLASTNHSVTDARLFGRTELTVQSGDYRVPGMDTRVARRIVITAPPVKVDQVN